MWVAPCLKLSEEPTLLKHLHPVHCCDEHLPYTKSVVQVRHKSLSQALHWLLCECRYDLACNSEQETNFYLPFFSTRLLALAG